MAGSGHLPAPEPPLLWYLPATDCEEVAEAGRQFRRDSYISIRKCDCQRALRPGSHQAYRPDRFGSVNRTDDRGPHVW